MRVFKETGSIAGVTSVSVATVAVQCTAEHALPLRDPQC